MKKTMVWLAAFLLVGTFQVQAQDLNEILDNYFEAMGLENMGKLENSITHMKLSQAGQEMPMKIYRKGQEKLRTEVSMAGMEMITVINGDKGWMINPMMGSKTAQPLPEAQLEQARKQNGDMGGPLYNWEEKGYKVELLGTDDLDGTEVYKIKLQMDADEEPSTLYMDAENYLILRMDSKADMMGQELNIVTSFSNFKKVKGVLMAHSIESDMGMMKSSMTVEKIETDVELDDKLFAKPE
jgi:outer membrane lipoprotein-sorting protein